MFLIVHVWLVCLMAGWLRGVCSFVLRAPSPQVLAGVKILFSSHMLSLFLHFLLVVCVYLCVFMCGCVHVSADFCAVQKRTSGMVVLELEVVNSPGWVLGTGLRPFVRAVCPLSL